MEKPSDVITYLNKIEVLIEFIDKIINTRHFAVYLRILNFIFFKSKTQIGFIIKAT